MPCITRPGTIAAIPGTGPGIGIPGITGIVPGTGILHGTTVTAGTRGTVPTGTVRIMCGIPGTGTAGTATARASITDLPVGITGPGGGGITALMQEDTAPVAVLSAPMSAA